MPRLLHDTVVRAPKRVRRNGEVVTRDGMSVRPITVGSLLQKGHYLAKGLRRLAALQTTKVI